MLCTQLSKKEEILMFVLMKNKVPGREKRLYTAILFVQQTYINMFQRLLPKIPIAFLMFTLLMLLFRRSSEK